MMCLEVFKIWILIYICVCRGIYIHELVGYVTSFGLRDPVTGRGADLKEAIFLLRSESGLFSS